ncbi:hypothetical protein ACFWDI_04285 [Streptomyces sp. NPDC060064]
MAARAGVGKDTIYRRWAGKPELVFEWRNSIRPSPPRPRSS